MPGESSIANRLRSLFTGSARPDGRPTPGARPISVRVSARSQVFRVRPPGGDVGPEPIMVPVTGHSVLVEVVASGRDSIVLDGIGAEIVDVADVDFSGVARTMSKLPDIVGADDVAPNVRQSVENYRPLDPPHFTAYLDRRPPVVGTAQGTSQQTVEFPVTLRPMASVSFFIAPVTSDQRLMSWNLLLRWTIGTTTSTIRWPLTVTGSTGYTTAHPGGTTTSTPIDRLAPDHWSPGWGDEERYVAAQLAQDADTALDELLGLTVLLPRHTSTGKPMISQVDDDGAVWVFTSQTRMRPAVAGQAIDSYNASILPFSEVLEDLVGNGFGVAVDPNTEINCVFPPRVVPQLLKQHKWLLSQRTQAGTGPSAPAEADRP